MNFQREIPSFDEDGEDARPDNDDEKPVVVQLGERDLTAEEVEQMEKEGVWRVKCICCTTKQTAYKTNLHVNLELAQSLSFISKREEFFYKVSTHNYGGIKERHE